MVRVMISLLLAALMALPVSASESRRKMISAEAQAEWSAVGRLNARGSGYCTATLIASDMVLTAAHCVTHRRTGRMLSPERLHFLAGYRAAKYVVHAQAASVSTAKGYYGNGRPISLDMAIVKLKKPIPESLVKPLPFAGETRVGAKVATYSYGRDRSFILSAESSCKILGRMGNLLGTTCEATPGVSGAPMIVVTNEGPKIAGVIIAMSGAKPPVYVGKAIAIAADAAARDQLFGTHVAAVTESPAPDARPVSGP